MSVGSMAVRPLGVIHAGPIHTLHHTDGSLVNDVFWYAPEFFEKRDLFSPSDGWAAIEKNRKRFMRKLASVPYRKELEDIIGRYVLALDQRNLDIAFLHLWSILEKVTGTGAKPNYDETVRRSVSFWQDALLAKEMLKAMRVHRNRLVHAARSTKEGDQVGYMIKSFVDPHLLRLLQNSYKVESLEEYGRYLGMPTKLADLQCLQKEMRRNLRYINASVKTPS